MKFKIECLWNKTKVLEGECTATMAYEIIKNFGSNFTQPEKVGYVVPSMESLLSAPIGTMFYGSGKDETGEARFYLNVLK